MEIGKPERIVHIEPVEQPVPARPSREPAPADPEREPVRPVREPVKR